MYRNRACLAGTVGGMVLLAGCGSSSGSAPVATVSATPSPPVVTPAQPVVTSAPPEVMTAPTPTPAVKSAPPVATPALPPPRPPVVDGTDTGQGEQAAVVLAGLVVRGRGPMTGYTREQFGQTWADVDRNGCDTRNDTLTRDLTATVHKAGTGGCLVLSGRLADPYTATSIAFEQGGASEVDIDHVVALGNAWVSGSAAAAADARAALANDPLNLTATSASANRQKGDGDAATWLPPNKAFRCAYVARQIAVKDKYGLSVTSAENTAMTGLLDDCASQRVPSGGGAAVAAGFGVKAATAAPTTAAPAPRPVTTTKAPGPEPGGDVSYQNCTEVREAGAAPITAGQPGYSRKLDRDGDGIACE